MRRIAIIPALIAALGLYVGLVGAGSYTIGKMKLSGTALEWDMNKLIITAQGNASFASLGPDKPMKPGTMQLKSIKAASIRVDLARTKGRTFTAKQAVATGGVVIDAKQASEETDQAGAARIVVRDVHATARTATLPESREVVLLTGDVLVKITEPGVQEPVAVLAGEALTVSLKDNKLRIEGQASKPAEFTITLKEEEKK